MERSRTNRPSFFSLLMWATGLWLVIVSLLLGSCGHQPTKISEGIAMAQGGLHVVEPLVANMPLDRWSEQLEAQQSRCEALAQAGEIKTIEQGRACLGWAKRRAELALQIPPLYDRLADDLERLRKLAAELEAIQQAIESGQVPPIAAPPSHTTQAPSKEPAP